MNNNDIRTMFSKLAGKLGCYERILVLGEVSLLPVYLATLTKSNVTYVELSQFQRKFIEKLKALNKGVLDNLTILSKSDMFEDRWKHNRGHFDVIVAEPFSSSSLLPWHHFYHWYLLNSIKRKHGLQKAAVYPSKAVLKACAVEFVELWKARAPIKKAEEFDLVHFDNIIESATAPELVDGHGLLEDVEPYSIWEYSHHMISEPFDIACFDFSRDNPDHDLAFEGEIALHEGRLDAVVLWVEFLHDDD